MAGVTTLLRYSWTSIRNIIVPMKILVIPKLRSSAFSSSYCKSDNLHVPKPPYPSPKAKKVPYEATDHGISRKDPFNWMSHLNDPDFTSYINEENLYAEAFMRDTEGLQSTLYSEMVSRIPSKISTPPERWGSWLYYQCIPEGKEYPVLCRKLPVEPNGCADKIISNWKRGFGEEQVLLDWNEIAERHGYVHIGACRVSPDHSFLAYTLDTTGNEQFSLQIKDLRNNSLLPQFKLKGILSLAWANDGSTLFYTLCDQNQRPHRVMYTKLGSDSMDDVQIFVENDPHFCVDIASTKDGKFITVNSNSRTSSEEEVYVINATDPQPGLQRFCKRVVGVQYFLEHHSGYFYILTNAPTNEGAEFSSSGYYLARCRDDDVQSVNVQDIIMPGKDIYLEDMDMFNDHLVLFLNKNGSPSVCSIHMPIHVEYEKQMEISDLNPWFFPLPASMSTLKPGSNHDFMSTVYRIILSSPVMPDLLIDFDMSRKSFSVLESEDVTNILANAVKSTSSMLLSNPDTSKRLNLTDEKENCSEDNGFKLLEGFSEKYFCEDREVISHDGVRIPLTILFSQTEFREGKCPGILHGYGAYGEGLDKSWCPYRLSLLDRGWIFAFADVRGGAGADLSWHRSGRVLNKLNSIYDFISCAEYLINEGFVHKNQLCAVASSAGCLLIGAAINMRPEMFRAAVLKVPFLDVLNTLLDPSLPLTTLDYEEFGNPQTKSHFDYIYKYSPYDNIPPGTCCPSMLVLSSFHDSRVGVWESAKWVARIRDTTCSRCSSSVILKTNMNAGHFQEGGQFSECRETAFEYAFLMKAMGIPTITKDDRLGENVALLWFVFFILPIFMMF